MAARPFSPPIVLRTIDASLPSASPQLKTPHDAIAIFVHACMLSAGFRLVGLSEDDHLNPEISALDPQPLPEHWNATPGTYGFRYAHANSPLTYLLKLSRLGSKTVIMGLQLQNDSDEESKTATFDIPTREYLKDDFFPYTLSPNQPLENAFVSAEGISNLAALVKIHIVQNLVVKHHGDEDEDEEQAPRQQQQQRQQQEQPREPFSPPAPYGPDPRFQPRPEQPIPAGGERPPGFDDEYEILQPPRGSGSNYPHPLGGRHPLSIGADDLNPPGLGPNPPLHGPFFGEGRGGGVGGVGPMGGMHPTGDHPMFGGQGEGRLQDPRFPMGARYDPVGPGDVPMGGLRGPRGPGRGPGGSPFGGFGGGYGGNDFI